MFSSPQNIKKFILDLLMVLVVVAVFITGVEAVAEYRTRTHAKLQKLNTHLRELQKNYASSSKILEGSYTLEQIRPGLMGIILEKDSCPEAGRMSAPCAAQQAHPRKSIYVVGPFRNNSWLSEKIALQCATPASKCVAWDEIEPYSKKYPYNKHYNPKRSGSAHRAFAIYTL